MKARIVIELTGREDKRKLAKLMAAIADLQQSTPPITAADQPPPECGPGDPNCG